MRPEQRRLFRYLQVTGTTPFTIKNGLLTYELIMLQKSTFTKDQLILNCRFRWKNPQTWYFILVSALGVTYEVKLPHF